MAKSTSSPTPIHLEAMKDVRGWLVKSEPFKYSWEQLEKDKVAVWDGVRNYAARNFLKEMKKGDEVFFYHSNEGLEIVGIATVTQEFFQDPTTEDDTWVSVKLKPAKKLKTPVRLEVMKSNTNLQNMKFIKIGRLSVSPVTHGEWETILELGK
jgi:predicted RNA-binding protein with PUA-like domain